MATIELYHPYSFWYSTLYLKRVLIVYGTGFFLLMLCVLFFLYRWWRQRQKNFCHRRYTLQRLEALQPKKFEQHPQKFYEEIAKLVRSYCFHQYGVGQQSMSDIHFMKAFLGTAACSPELLENLATIWDAIAFSKFVEHTAMLDHMQHVKQNIYYFVDKSTPLDTSGMLKE